MLFHEESRKFLFVPPAKLQALIHFGGAASVTERGENSGLAHQKALVNTALNVKAC